jgi:hypothetical protein
MYRQAVKKRNKWISRFIEDTKAAAD